ncbi:MAG: NAD(P)/FAD-dependent oxidoreductase [Actinomycetota bacterium]|nr:FAD-dependent oxidoreductase [Actinomycetota bacterium]
MTDRFVIVGANLAGGSAATTLREEGFDGTITLIGAEAHPPYERPPLSKEYLRGEMPVEKTFLHAGDYYEEKSIDTVFGVRASRIDTDRKVVTLEDGESVPYDKLLIATGVRNRRFPIPGLDLPGVHDLRTIDDASAIRAEIAPGKTAAVVGMGFIGAEVAASLRSRGIAIKVVEGFKVPLARVLGEDIGGVLEGLHRDHGVEMTFGDVVERFEGSERVERVVTKAGAVVECDFAVVGVGVQPNVEICEGSAIAVDNGILVDAQCRTNVEDVYAAGDVANHAHPVFGRNIRVEHWQNAIKQGPAAAKSMLGNDAAYDEIHWFWSDQYDDNIQYAGHHMTWDDLVVRGSLKERNFIAFYMNGGLIDAAVALNRGKDLRRTMPLIKARKPVDPVKLRDDDIELKSLASA